MNFYFYPKNEDVFKEKALNNYVRTLVIDELSGEIQFTFARHVGKIWQQSCKNNIETDHRIKPLNQGHYEVHSWVTKSPDDFDTYKFFKIKAD